MDVQTNTPEGLSDEQNKKKYITLETASKVSGYTKDYLERLCRLNKVDYRTTKAGEFVVEIESVLKETHTILLSYDGLTFADNAELTDPTPQIVGSILSAALKEIKVTTPAKPEVSPSDLVRDVPHFDQMSYLNKRTESAPLAPNMSQLSSARKDQDVAGEKTENPSVSAPVPASVPVSAPIFVSEQQKTVETPVEIVQVSVVAPASVSVKDKDEWDNLLFSDNATSAEKVMEQAIHSVKQEVKQSPSPYHPISTSLDPSVHHDPSPLFPPVGMNKDGSKGAVTLSIMPSLSSTAPSSISPAPSSPVVDAKSASGTAIENAIEKLGTQQIADAAKEIIPPQKNVSRLVLPIPIKPGSSKDQQAKNSFAQKNELPSVPPPPQPPPVNPESVNIQAAQEIHPSPAGELHHILPEVRSSPLLASREKYFPDKRNELQITDSTANMGKSILPLILAFVLIGATLIVLRGIFPGNAEYLAVHIKSLTAGIGNAFSETQIYQRP